jgi:NADH/NAD ratio-sensing transcriptional regulator Rex
MSIPKSIKFEQMGHLLYHSCMNIIISLKNALYELEKQNGKRYSISELAREIELNPRTVRELFFGTTEQIRTSTMVKAIDFFKSQKHEIACSDFFTVTNESEVTS